MGPLYGETAFPRGHPSGVYRNVSCTHVGPPCWWDTAAFVYRAPLPPRGVHPAIVLAGCTARFRPHEPETPWRVSKFMPAWVRERRAGGRTDAPPLVTLAPAPCGRFGAGDQGGLKATFRGGGGGSKPYSLPPEGGDRARTPTTTTPGGEARGSRGDEVMIAPTVGKYSTKTRWSGAPKFFYLVLYPPLWAPGGWMGGRMGGWPGGSRGLRERG